MDGEARANMNGEAGDTQDPHNICKALRFNQYPKAVAVYHHGQSNSIIKVAGGITRLGLVERK